MKHLSLFSGAGFGEWATHYLLGWETVGYVEWNKYCQRVLRARIDDGLFSRAPIFGDIREFILSGCAEQYRGFIDVVTAGFPCQPFSNAGQRLGSADERNMWPATIECIRLVRPRFALLENVADLLSSGYFGTILADLAAAGYDTKWTILSACAVGAPHTRERLFILANAHGERGARGWQRSDGRTCREGDEALIWAPHRSPGSRHIQIPLWQAGPTEILRVADGDTDRGHRIKAAGNGQVPSVVATAWNVLSKEIFA